MLCACIDVSVAKYTARAVILHLGLNLTMGVTNYENLWLASVIRALCTVMAGAEVEDLPVVIASPATEIKYYGFALPDGTRLVGLWTDGAAVTVDPGIPTTFTFPGITDQTVPSIDVLHSFHQQLITSEEDGNLVIRDLLVKDYPLILRVAPTMYMYLPTVFHGHGQ
jgi:hypothetical protein